MKRARSEQAKDQRRHILLQAALDEFYEQGFATARMEDIAKRAGFSKGTLYLYFKSKEDLFTSLIETRALPNVARLEAATEQAPTFSAAIQALTTMAPLIIQTTDVPRLMKIIISDAPNFPRVIQMYRKNVIDRILQMMADVLARAHERREIEIDDPALTARLIISPIAFSALWHVLFDHQDKDQIDLEKLFQLHGKMMLRALAPK